MAPPRSGAPNRIPVRFALLTCPRRMPTLRTPLSGSLVTQRGVRYGPASLPGVQVGMGNLFRSTDEPLWAISLHGPVLTTTGAIGLASPRMVRSWMAAGVGSHSRATDIILVDAAITPETTRPPG